MRNATRKNPISPEPVPSFTGSYGQGILYPKMRARNIKPGFFLNSKLSEVPALTRILFIGLWCLADRRGRLEDDPKRIKGGVLPYDEYDTSLGLAQLHEQGLIERYAKNGNHYIQIVKFEKHQYPHHREPESVIPAPHKPRALPSPAHLNPDVLNPESPILNPEEKKIIKEKFSVPKPEEVTAYAKTIGFVLNGGAFCDHYESNGWKVGRVPMTSWKAAVRTWKHKDREDHRGTNVRQNVSVYGPIAREALRNRQAQGLRKVSESAIGKVLDGLRNQSVDQTDGSTPERGESER